MPDTLPTLLEQKAAVLRQISELDDFRPGSITTTTGRCGNPNCHCHRPGQPGHGPNFRLTYKAEGKTMTESFPNPAAREKAQREIEEYRRWKQLSQDFVAINTTICQLRPLGESQLTPQERKRLWPSSRRSRGKSTRG